MAYDQYHDFDRPLFKVQLTHEGKTPNEVEYYTALKDAQFEVEDMRRRIYLFRPLQFIPYVRRLISYWEEYHLCYLWTAQDEAYTKYMEPS